MSPLMQAWAEFKRLAIAELGREQAAKLFDDAAALLRAELTVEERANGGNIIDLANRVRERSQ